MIQIPQRPCSFHKAPEIITVKAPSTRRGCQPKADGGEKRPAAFAAGRLLFLIQAKAPVGAGIVADVDADLRAGLLHADPHAVNPRRGQVLKQHGAVFLRDKPYWMAFSMSSAL